MDCAPLLAALVSLVMAFGSAGAEPPATLCTGVQASSNSFKRSLVYVTGAVKVESVDVVSQQSGSPCTKGVSYGFVGPDVFVDKGCRGIFNACYIPGINQQITCSSDNFKEKVCYANFPIQYHNLRSQVSHSPCVENQSYSIVANMVIVRNGCRGVFNVGTTNKP